MYLSHKIVSSTHYILAGTKYKGTVIYIWYYCNDVDPLKPYALTDSYREFWL